jgi:Ca2+-binding EF-hand superfamily protein
MEQTMKHKIKTIILVSLISSTSHSYPPPLNNSFNQATHINHIMLRLDKNKDNKISLAEFMEQYNQRFTRADRNNDGSIDIQEARHPKARALFKYADTDHNHKISLMEFNGANIERFRFIDANQDGFISGNEGVNAARNKRFKAIDKNNDGNISPQEFMSFNNKAG